MRGSRPAVTLHLVRWENRCGARAPSLPHPLRGLPYSPMPPHDPGAEAHAPTVPSMLDLVRLSPRLLFPPGGVDLYRQIALLTDLSEDDEVLDVACGRAVSLEYFVREYGVHGSGVDVDPMMIEAAEERSRDAELGGRMQFQSGRSDALPYRDEIFDVTVGEIGLCNHCEPEEAVRELARVTKPGGHVVLVQLAWKAPVDPARQRVLSDHLGARPLMLVEWKRLLREAGVSSVHTEDWSDEETSFRPTVAKPFLDFAELFTVTEKLGILRRAWRRWGWRGVRTVVEREGEVHKLLTSERILGLDLLKGRKGEVEAAAVSVSSSRELAEERASTRPTQGESERPELEPASENGESAETAGLPLFGPESSEP